MLNVSRQSINELVRRGVLAIGPDKLLDVELARLAIAERLKPGAKTAAAVQASPPAPPPPPAPAGALAPVDALAPTSFHLAKTLREGAEAQMAQLRLAELRGELVKAEEVRRRAFELARGARDLLMAIPARVAAIVAAETDPAKCQEILDAEVRQVCAEIAKMGEQKGG